MVASRTPGILSRLRPALKPSPPLVTAGTLPQNLSSRMRVRLEDVNHDYAASDDSAPVHVLDGVSLTIESGSFTILRGASGSGKSTLLNLIGAVDKPTSGRILLGDIEISSLSERELTLVRRRSIGFIFQFFNLIPTLTVIENVSFPLALARVRQSEIDCRAGAVLDEVGLSHRAGHYPSELSGGEMQRVAIGRAIVHRPALILADEPTGNLDSKNGTAILELISRIHRTLGSTIVLATHSDRAASYGQKTIEVADGRVREADEP
jgi:putative ABC transport system ATP-binding protein